MARDPSLHILQHALGLDDYGRGTAYRNHFVTDEGCDNFPLCMALVEAGHMERSGPSIFLGGGGKSYCFTVTWAGEEFVLAHSPKPPLPKRSRQGYSKSEISAMLKAADVGEPLTAFEAGVWIKRYAAKEEDEVAYCYGAGSTQRARAELFAAAPAIIRQLLEGGVPSE